MDNVQVISCVLLQAFQQSIQQDGTQFGLAGSVLESETTANLRCLNMGCWSGGDVCDYLVHLTVGSISNNFNQLKDASWILGYKRTL